MNKDLNTLQRMYFDYKKQGVEDYKLDNWLKANGTTADELNKYQAPNMVESAVIGAGTGATRGYLDRLNASFDTLTDNVADALLPKSKRNTIAPVSEEDIYNLTPEELIEEHRIRTEGRKILPAQTTYQAYKSLYEKESERANAAHPIITTIGDIAGATLTSGVPALAGAGKATLGQLAKRGALEGAAYGLVRGSSEGEGLSERAINAGTSAALGGAAGAVAPVAIAGVGKALGGAGKAISKLGGSKLTAAEQQVDDVLRKVEANPKIVEINGERINLNERYPAYQLVENREAIKDTANVLRRNVSDKEASALKNNFGEFMKERDDNFVDLVNKFNPDGTPNTGYKPVDRVNSTFNPLKKGSSTTLDDLIGYNKRLTDQVAKAERQGILKLTGGQTQKQVVDDLTTRKFATDVLDSIRAGDWDDMVAKPQGKVASYLSDFKVFNDFAKQTDNKQLQTLIETMKIERNARGNVNALKADLNKMINRSMQLGDTLPAIGGGLLSGSASVGFAIGSLSKLSRFFSKKATDQAGRRIMDKLAKGADVSALAPAEKNWLKRLLDNPETQRAVRQLEPAPARSIIVLRERLGGNDGSRN